MAAGIKLSNHRSGEVLLDQERYQDAIEKFERAIELEKAK
jgi:tetratricopeptide (TPR) repeat protein